MVIECVYKISTRYLQKWLRYDTKHVKSGTFQVISGLNRDFPNFILTHFDALKSVLGSFFAFFAKVWSKNMYRSSKSIFFLGLTFFTWWPEMTMTGIMVTKHRKWYLPTNVGDTNHANKLTFVCAWRRYFARQAHLSRKVEHVYFDMTCDVISDLQGKFFTVIG